MNGYIESPVDRAGKPGAAMLSAEKERDLIERWRDAGDRRAGDRLVRSFAPLVRKYASKFRKYGLPIDDLTQEGNLALLEAAKRFDTGRGVRFATYAVWWIRSRLQEFVVRNRSIVRLGSTNQDKSLFFKLGHLQAAIGQKEDSVSVANRSVANALGLKLSQVERMDAQLRKGDLYLDAPLPGGDDDAGRLLADVRPNPEASAAERETRDALARRLADAMNGLNQRERRIVSARRLSDKPMPLRVLGEEFGVSTERVRQIEQDALTKLRRSLSALVPVPQDLFSASPQPSLCPLLGA